VATTVRRIYVVATAEQVWDYLQTPKNIVDWWPNCEEIHAVRPLSEGGFVFKWTDKPAGVTCCGEIEETVVEPGEDLALHIAGDICGDIRWQVKQNEAGTHVTFESDYDLPVRALIPHLSPFRLLMFQQDEADAIMEKVTEHFGARAHDAS
jgi:uncharacterized protein YndB with AHSA1/START domain